MQSPDGPRAFLTTATVSSGSVCHTNGTSIVSTNEAAEMEGENFIAFSDETMRIIIVIHSKL